MKELMKRAAKCAPEELKLTYHEPSSRLVFNGNWGLCIDSDGSTVQNASGLMVLIEAMKAEEDRLSAKAQEKPDNLSDYEDDRLYKISMKLGRCWADLSTQSILEAFCEVFES